MKTMLTALSLAKRILVESPQAVVGLMAIVVLFGTSGCGELLRQNNDDRSSQKQKPKTVVVNKGLSKQEEEELNERLDDLEKKVEAQDKQGSKESTANPRTDQSQQQVEGEVQTAAEAYYQAAKARDWEYTYSHLDSETQSAFTEDEWFAKNEWLANTGPVTYTIQTVDVDPSNPESVASVAVVVTSETDGSTSMRNTYFVYEDGSWKHRFGSEEYDLFATAQTGDSSASSSGSSSTSAQGAGGQESEQQDATFGDGTYQVGTDIQPGTYRTREGSTGCYYERLSGFSGELNDIIANNNTDAPAVVTIQPTDAGFTASSCGTWSKDLSAITESKTSFGEGAYIVGTDFEPGTYRNSGGTGCYYERLRDFTGDMNSIIANNNTDNPTVVEIATSDAGFRSNGCGTWTKLE
jgi:hypothetical protein